MMKHIVVFLIGAILLLGGCSGTPVSATPPPEPYFPVQTEDPGIYMLALLPGTLTMDGDGYLRVNDALVIWPYGYSLQTEGNDIWILNDKEEKAARVGDNVTLGGGYVSDDVVTMKIGHTLPEGCEEPFFLANPLTK